MLQPQWGWLTFVWADLLELLHLSVTIWRCLESLPNDDLSVRSFFDILGVRPTATARHASEQPQVVYSFPASPGGYRALILINLSVDHFAFFHSIVFLWVFFSSAVGKCFFLVSFLNEGLHAHQHTVVNWPWWSLTPSSNQPQAKHVLLLSCFLVALVHVSPKPI